MPNASWHEDDSARACRQWFALRRHALVLRSCYGDPIVCVNGGGSDCQPSRHDPGPGPRRPRHESRLDAGSSPLTAGQADRGAGGRFGGRPPDRRDAPAPVMGSDDMHRLSRAAPAIPVEFALLPIGRCNPRTAEQRRRLECLRGSSSGAGPIELNLEKARMLDVNRPGRDRQRAQRFARARNARPTLTPRRRRGTSPSSVSMSRSSR
jgi:hypothetical protein